MIKRKQFQEVYSKEEHPTKEDIKSLNEARLLTRIWKYIDSSPVYILWCNMSYLNGYTHHFVTTDNTHE